MVFFLLKERKKKQISLVKLEGEARRGWGVRKR